VDIIIKILVQWFAPIKEDTAMFTMATIKEQNVEVGFWCIRVVACIIIPNFCLPNVSLPVSPIRLNRFEACIEEVK
ncbi:hypothetical protein ACUOGR_24420, partial [Escherichia coli]